MVSLTARPPHSLLMSQYAGTQPCLDLNSAISSHQLVGKSSGYISHEYGETSFLTPVNRPAHPLLTASLKYEECRHRYTGRACEGSAALRCAGGAQPRLELNPAISSCQLVGRSAGYISHEYSEIKDPLSRS